MCFPGAQLIAMLSQLQDSGMSGLVVVVRSIGNYVGSYIIVTVVTFIEF